MNSPTQQFQAKSIDQISYAVKDIDKTIESWSRLYGIEPWTFRENGGLDAKGRPWMVIFLTCILLKM